MRIALFGQTGPYAPTLLRALLGSPCAREVVLVVEGRKFLGGRNTWMLLEPDVQALPDGDDLAALAVAAGIPCLQSRDVNADDSIAAIAAHGVDWFVCVGFDRLFCRGLLRQAGRGGINIHPSKLPALRGPAPIFWALKGGACSLTVSLHRLDVREDHGPVLAQAEFALPQRASAEDVYRLAARVAAPLLIDVLAAARAGTLVGAPQDHSQATRAPRPQPQDAYFESQQWACETLVNFCCVAPFSRAAWTRLGEEVFFVRRGVASLPNRRMPVHYMLEGTRLFVQCRDGVAELEVQA